jgi:hypothetical protein
LGRPEHDEGEDVAEKLRVWEAFREGSLNLPCGYSLEFGAGVLLLRRVDGSVAATFNARGATPAEVARTAEEDHRANGRSTA